MGRFVELVSCEWQDFLTSKYGHACEACGASCLAQSTVCHVEPVLYDENNKPIEPTTVTSKLDDHSTIRSLTYSIDNKACYKLFISYSSCELAAISLPL